MIDGEPRARLEPRTMSTPPDEIRDAFLSETRIGILTTLDSSGWPISMPVWFEWDGSRARVFTTATSRKMRRLNTDPRVSLIVSNEVGQPEYWVAIDGEVEVLKDGAVELAKRLADRYWDMSDDEHRKAVDSWVVDGDRLRVLEIVPTKIRTYN